MTQLSYLDEPCASPVQQNGWKTPTEFPDLSNVDTLSLDCETNGLHFMRSVPIGIAISYEADGLKSHYFPFGHSEGNMDPDRVKQWVRREVAFKNVVFANAKYDCHMLKNWGVDLEGMGVRPIDVQFCAALLDDNRYAGLSLETLGQRYLGEGKDVFQGDKNKMADYPAWGVGPYAQQDASLTLRLYNAFLPMILEEALERVLELENSIIYIVCEIERNGSHLDREKLERWLIQAIKEFDAVIREIHRMTGIGLNPNATESMESLYKVVGLPIPKEERKQKHGGTKMVTSFTAENLARANHPVINLALRAKRLDSLRTKYLEPFCNSLNWNNDIFFALHQLKSDEAGTVSGRFSSSGGDDERSGYCFNVQQVSKKDDEIGEEYPIRELFTADRGAKYLASDARQIEYRLFAHFSRAKSILAAYEKDPYTQYHKLVLSMLQSVGSTIDYQQCKNTNFARLYGAGTEKISKMIKASLETTKLFVSQYDKIMPEANPFLKKMAKQAETEGHVATLMGRRSRFADGKKLYTAVNRLIQGSAADLMKLKMRTIYRERKNLGILKMRQVVHDEQDADVDPDPKYVGLLQEAFDSQELNLRVPILWELATGNSWKDCK